MALPTNHIPVETPSHETLLFLSPAPVQKQSGAHRLLLQPFKKKPYDLEFLCYLFMGSFFGKELMILMSMNQTAWSERPLGEVSEEHSDNP